MIAAVVSECKKLLSILLCRVGQRSELWLRRVAATQEAIHYLAAAVTVIELGIQTSEWAYSTNCIKLTD